MKRTRCLDCRRFAERYCAGRDDQRHCFDYLPLSLHPFRAFCPEKYAVPKEEP